MPAGVSGFSLDPEYRDLSGMSLTSGWRGMQRRGAYSNQIRARAARDTVSMVHSPRQFGNKQKPIQREETDKSKNKQRPRDGKLRRWGRVETRGDTRGEGWWVWASEGT